MCERSLVGADLPGILWRPESWNRKLSLLHSDAQVDFPGGDEEGHGLSYWVLEGGLC